MNGNIRLSDYATTPLYNIKAVVQATGISPSTLRAWERRYNMCRPQRSESGYRLYSDRDIATIRWLKAQVDAGMAISQAVAWFETLNADNGVGGQGVLPNAAALDQRQAAGAPLSSVRSFEALRADLMETLLHFDELAAEQIMAEAFALYSVEQVGEEVATPVLVEIGERWHRRELSVTSEHFASNYLLHRLTALLRAVPNLDHGPLIWVGCAPGELHEGGAVLLAIYLRRAGYLVHYLGQNLPVDGFAAEVQRQLPAMVIFSASTPDGVAGLQEIVAHVAAMEPPQPVLGYGGRIFVLRPELRNTISAVYLGDSAHDAVSVVRDLLHVRGAHAKPKSTGASA